MKTPLAGDISRAVDGIQERISSYACAHNYGALSPEAIHTEYLTGQTLKGYFSALARTPSAVRQSSLQR